MHRLFLGLNLWSVFFMALAAALGWRGSPHHVKAGIFAAVFACLVQSGVIALFLGAGKLAKEHIGRFAMPLGLLDRVNGVYHRLFPTAAVGATLLAAASIVGGLSDVGWAPVWLHHGMAVGAFAYLVAVVPREYRLQRGMHEVIVEIERLLPPPAHVEAAPPHPGYRPDRVVFDRTGRARALLYIGLTLPLPYLGYTWISGQDVSFLAIPTAVATAACLGGAAWLRWSRSNAGGTS